MRQPMTPGRVHLTGCRRADLPSDDTGVVEGAREPIRGAARSPTGRLVILSIANGPRGLPPPRLTLAYHRPKPAAPGRLAALWRRVMGHRPADSAR